MMSNEPLWRENDLYFSVLMRWNKVFHSYLIFVVIVCVQRKKKSSRRSFPKELPTRCYVRDVYIAGPVRGEDIRDIIHLTYIVILFRYMLACEQGWARDG